MTWGQRSADAARSDQAAAGGYRGDGDHLRRPCTQGPWGDPSTSCIRQSVTPSARWQCDHPHVCAGTRAGTVVLPARRRRTGTAARIDAGVSGFADGDFSDGDLPSSPRLLRTRGQGHVRRRADPFALPGLHFTRETAALDGAQPDRWWCGDTGRVRDVPVVVCCITSSTTCGARIAVSYSSASLRMAPSRAGSSTGRQWCASIARRYSGTRTHLHHRRLFPPMPTATSCWRGTTAGTPELTVLVHGDEEAMQAFAAAPG